MDFFSDFLSGKSSLAVYICGYLISVFFIWYFGGRITEAIDEISNRIKLEKSFAGLFFLSVSTSLPEGVISITAAVTGTPEMATGNLLGGVVFQILLLVLIDSTVRNKPLTFVAATPTILFQGVGLITLLALVISISLLDKYLSFGFVSAGSALLLGSFSVILWLSHQYGRNEPWKAVNSNKAIENENCRVKAKDLSHLSMRQLLLSYILGSGVILIGGVAIANSARGIVEQTGLNASFVGATLLAISSSMPEVSTTLKAARLGAYSMAISNIFGSNICAVTLLSFADVAYGQSSIYRFVNPGNYLSISVGIIGTAIYLLGLLERKNRSFFRLGYDSWLVLILILPSFYYLWLLTA